MNKDFGTKVKKYKSLLILWLWFVCSLAVIVILYFYEIIKPVKPVRADLLKGGGKLSMELNSKKLKFECMVGYIGRIAIAFCQPLL